MGIFEQLVCNKKCDEKTTARLQFLPGAPVRNTGECGKKSPDCGMLPVRQLTPIAGTFRLYPHERDLGFYVFFYKFHDCRKGQGMGRKKARPDPSRLDNCNRAGGGAHICCIEHEDMVGVELTEGAGYAFGHCSCKKHPGAGNMYLFNLPCSDHPEPVKGQKLVPDPDDRNTAGS